MRRRLRRLGAGFIAAALDPRLGSSLIVALIGIHVVAWTAFFAIAANGQEPHADSLETYAWSRELLWGYGKHPPLSAWVARAWFSIFPAADWAMYGLAMAVIGGAIWACWALALHVVERRRAVLVVLLLLLYPLFTIRGSRYTPDLMQVPLFVLVVLAFVVAFESRKIVWGVLLGLACTCAVLTKYWALLVIGAIGVAALADPGRRGFFRSPIPYVAGAVFCIALIPHLIWLVQSDYAPIVYALDYTAVQDHSPLEKAGIELRHHFGLLLPVFLILTWAVTRPWIRVPVDSRTVRVGAARHIWAIAATLIAVPPVLAVLFRVHMVVDWGIPLYSLVPLAVMSIPSLGVSLRALTRTAGLWVVCVVAAIIAAPVVSVIEAKTYPERYSFNGPDLAAKVTQLWHEHNADPLPVIAGRKPIAAAISFYSPDHPVIFTDFNQRIATWIDIRTLAKSGFVAVCASDDAICQRAASTIDPTLSKVQITTEPGRSGPSAPPQSFTILLARQGQAAF